MSRNFLSRNDELRRGDFLMSNNRKWKAVFQDDGNLVVFGWTPVWSSDTRGCDAVRLLMQPDGNLAMLSSSDVSGWQTNTRMRSDGSMSRLQLTDEGRLVVCRGAEELWSSGKSKGSK